MPRINYATNKKTECFTINDLSYDLQDCFFNICTTDVVTNTVKYFDNRHVNSNNSNYIFTMLDLELLISMKTLIENNFTDLVGDKIPSHIEYIKTKDGVLHCDDGPAIRFNGGTVEKWYKNGELHREDGPAFIKYYGLGDKDEYYVLHNIVYDKHVWEYKVLEKKLHKIKDL